MPTSKPEGWNPGATFGAAGGTLRSAYQGITDALVWLFVVVVPIVAPIVLVVWAAWYFGWNRRRKGTV
jgi:hypothetical protein